jgi:hypothetical protein
MAGRPHLGQFFGLHDKHFVGAAPCIISLLSLVSMVSLALAMVLHLSRVFVQV